MRKVLAQLMNTESGPAILAESGILAEIAANAA